MKPSSQRLTIKPKNDATQAAAAPTIAKNTLPTAHVKTHGIAGMKTVKAKIATCGKPEQQAGVFVAFEGSSVRAHDAVMKGVSGRALTRIWESTRGTLPTDAVLKAIGVSARTAHRVKTEPDKPLDARTTDGIYRLESVRAMAKEVLGSAEAANEWLMSEAMGLEFRKPIDLVSTSPGAEAVKTLLQRMRYGVYA
jgi:putative toxin-antitoxin system antitoxin component (TIGR02293 family)